MHNKLDSLMTELHFMLGVEDEWPPVATEGVPCTQVAGGYRIETPPLFIKYLSVGDIIAINSNENDEVISWEYVSKSSRTTIWLLRMAKSNNIDIVLNELSSLHCNIVQLPQYGCYSIDVPAECAIEAIDVTLEKLDKSCVAVAFPSFRHK